jgi:pimeloyl-ACP methyl ester carboxylesterase
MQLSQRPAPARRWRHRKETRTMNVVLVILLIIVGLVLAGMAVQAILTRRDRERFPPRGQLVDVGGHRLHMIVQGEAHGNPTVILEAGMASIAANWAWVQAELAKTTRVVAYDRASLGWSDPGTKPLDAAKSARELHTLLERAGIEGPYVLAGHSYGGLVMRMFRDLYPDEVAGLALVDSSHPDEWLTIPASREGRTVAFINRITGALCRIGLLRLFHMEEAFITGLPPLEYGEMRAYLATPRGWLTGADGILAWRNYSREQVNATAPLGDLPLFVLSVSEQAHYAAELTALQNALPALSSNSKHITVEGATHYTLVSKQEYAAIVSDAIRQVITAAQTGRSLAEPLVPDANASRSDVAAR